MNRMRLRIIASTVAALLVSFGLGSFGIVTSASAQQPQSVLLIASVEVSEVGQTQSTVKYEALIEIENAGEAEFHESARVDYRVDYGELSLVYVVHQLEAGDVARFKFRFEVEPGERQLDILLGDETHTTDIRVTASDLDLTVTGQRVKRGGIVEIDYNVANSGDRDAEAVGLQGRWENLDDGNTGDADFGTLSDTLASGDSEVGYAQFNVDPGSYRFHLIVNTPTVESGFENNAETIEYEVDFVDLKLELSSTEAIRWHTEGRGLIKVSVAVTNQGVDDSGVVTVGIACPDEACSASKLMNSIATGETSTREFEAWLPVGEITATLYVGENEHGFRWGAENVIEATVSVPDPPPLEWSLSTVSDAQDFRYWSDGSANAVFETTMVNTGSDLVAGDVLISVECAQSDEVLEDCGGDYTVELDPSEHPNATRHTVKIPQGRTALTFSYGREPPVTTTARVPERILGVDRDIWECFADTSNLRINAPDDVGVGCAGWRKDYILKWPVGESVKVWTSGDEEYKQIFDQVLKDISPVLNLEFETAATKSRSDMAVYLGLSRTETRLDGLRCNRAAGCAQFDIASDGSITGAMMVVWPPTVAKDQIGHEHMVYSIALHELIHVLTGTLHRHHDRTSVMSYDSLDYLTLGEQDEALLRIASHPLVEPGMRFSEIRELVVFTDELVDPPVPEDPTLKDVLRKVHANLMDAESVKFEISGGWPGCGRTFDSSQYSIGGLRPKASLWVHMSNDIVDLFIIRATSPVQQIEFWLKTRGTWVQVSSPTAQRILGFRDSFSTPLGMLASINIYDDGTGLNVVSEEGSRTTLQVSLGWADVRTPWSTSKQLDVELEIDTESYEISSYKLDWSFEPTEEGVCDSYQVEASGSEYGGEFEIPAAIRRQSALVD